MEDFHNRLKDVYGFPDIEDHRYSDSRLGGNQALGQALKQITNLVEDYDGREESHNRLQYNEGLTEGEINYAINKLVENSGKIQTDNR